MSTANEEVAKVSKHLDLLRQEHVKLQSRYVDLQRKYDVLLASSRLAAGEMDTQEDTSFVGRLMQTVAQLFEKDLYSDITIHLDGHQLRAHRFVLASRSDHWTTEDLSYVDHLHFDDMAYNIGYTLLRWVYTDQLDPKLGDTFVLDLLKAAQKFQLNSLLQRCEQLLISRLDIQNCISFYQVADEINAQSLREKCSQLITTRWDDFTYEDFGCMSAQLLYKMLRSKVPFPLHSAVKLRREDVVFLYLIEFDMELTERLNASDSDGCLSLSLALSSGQESLAKTLVSHGADVNARDTQGRTLLLLAAEKCDHFACNFLLENGADVAAIQDSTGRNALHVLSDVKLMELENRKEILAIVDKLLDSPRLDLNLRDLGGQTALHLAVERNNMFLLDRLLDKNNIKVDLKDKHEQTPLAVALNLENGLEMAEKLVGKGADVNSSRSDGVSLLHSTVQLPSSVQFLIKNDANVNKQSDTGETSLHVACRQAATQVVQLLLAAGADANLNTNDPSSSSALHVAVASGDCDLVNAIVDSGVPLNLDAIDGEGETALGRALSAQLYEISSVLIKSGANVDVVDRDGWSLLLRAIENGDEQCALFLIRSGSNAAVRSPAGLSALQLSVVRQLCGVVQALCRAGADMNVTDADGLPPLWTALSSRQLDVASVLVEHGCDTDGWAPGPSECQQTMLHRAIDENDEDIACFLIRSLCQVNVCRRPGPNGEGAEEAHSKETPLHMAAAWGLNQVVNDLIEHGANANAQDVEGKTPVHVAVLNHQHDILEILLRAPHLSLSDKDKRGLTPLACAMQAKNNRAAKAILDREPRVANQMNNKGYNLLHTAVKQADLESVLFLLSVHLDVNVATQDSGRLTPLHLAAEAGNEMVLRNLLLAGAQVNALNSRNQSPLHLAAWNDHSDLCKILLENGANPDALDEKLNNALHVAVHKGGVSCVRTLLTESNINAVALNFKNQTPLLILGQYGRETAAAIFELFVQTMPDYPLDKVDSDGNSMLLCAYMNGNAQLCKAAVRVGVCLGTTNSNGVSIFNYETPTKQLLFRLLDQLAQEPKWAESDSCSECGNKFSFTVRKHHCRHCGRVLCAKCSERQMPIIKYDLQKPVRVCDVCYDVLTLGAQ